MNGLNGLNGLNGYEKYGGLNDEYFGAKAGSIVSAFDAFREWWPIADAESEACS